MSGQLISTGEAQAFYAHGTEQLDHLLIGEQEAKLGMMVAMVSGMNVVLVGEPGGGKTTLATKSHRIVEGIDDSDVANVPPQSDLMPQHLIGGTTIVTKTTEYGGEKATETTEANVNALIHPHTKVIVANEINRINPYALNGILEAWESRELVTTAGSIFLDELEYGVATMNPSEKRQGTFPVAAATTSRHAIGAVLGGPHEDRDHLVTTILQGKGESNPDKIEAVTNLNSLHAMRIRANEGTSIPGNLHTNATRLIKDAVETLRDNDIREADGRIAKQIAKIAKTHAVLQGQEQVDELDLRQAVRFVLTARLGILATGGVDISAIVDSAAGL